MFDSGHLPPEPSDDLPSYQVLQTNVEGEYYHVYIACYACDSKIAAKGRPVINVGTTQQPWIWAVHPLQVMQTADTNHPLRYHGDKYGEPEVFGLQTVLDLLLTYSHRFLHSEYGQWAYAVLPHDQPVNTFHRQRTNRSLRAT